MKTYTMLADGVSLSVSAEDFKLSEGGVLLWPQPVVVPPPVAVGPPEPITLVSASDSLAVIQGKLNAVPAGGSLVFPNNMIMPSGTLFGKSGVVLWADGDVKVNGSFDFTGKTDWVIRGRAPGQGFVFKNDYRVIANNADRWAVGCCIFNAISSPSNWWNGTAIAFNGASNGLIINNDFNNCMGNVLGMYDMDRVVVDGNRFTGCWQPIALHGPTSGTLKGHDIHMRRNVFLLTQRAAIETGTGEEFFSGMVIENNFFDEFDCRGEVGTMLPISLVSQRMENTTVVDNYIDKGSKPLMNSGGIWEWTTGTEFTGTGLYARNKVINFRYNLVYEQGAVIRDHILFGTPHGFTVNEPDASFADINNVIVSTKPDKPAQPARIAW